VRFGFASISVAIAGPLKSGVTVILSRRSRGRRIGVSSLIQMTGVRLYLSLCPLGAGSVPTRPESLAPHPLGLAVALLGRVIFVLVDLGR